MIIYSLFRRRRHSIGITPLENHLDDGYEQERAIRGHLRYESRFLVRLLLCGYETPSLTGSPVLE